MTIVTRTEGKYLQHSQLCKNCKTFNSLRDLWHKTTSYVKVCVRCPNYGPKRTRGLEKCHQLVSPVFLETQSSLSLEGSKSDSTIIIQEDATKPSHFINSDNILYKFKSHELDESLSSYHPEYHADQGDNGSQNDIITVLFTRRNIEQEAKNFLSTLDRNNVIEYLQERVRMNSSSCCLPRAPLLIVD